MAMAQQKAQMQELEIECSSLRERLGEVDRLQAELGEGNTRVGLLEAKQLELTTALGQQRKRYAELEMEAATLRERAASNERLKGELKSTQSQHQREGDEKAHALNALQGARQHVATLELEISSLKERVIEADRLQHELTATREKMRVMEQRSLILDKERAGAAQQLEAELEAARSKIQAIELRRNKGGRKGVGLGVDDAGSTIVSSALSSASGPTARSGSPRARPLPSGTPPASYATPIGDHRSKGHASSRPRRTGRDATPLGTGPRDRYVHASPRGASAKRPPQAKAMGGRGPARDDEYYSAY